MILLVHNFHVPRPHVFTSVYSETCNTKVHQVLQVIANRVSDIVFAQCQVHETHQPTVTYLKNMTKYIVLVQYNYRPRSEGERRLYFHRHLSVQLRGREGGVDQGPGHNTPPGPGHNTPSPRDLVTTPPFPPGPGHNTPLPPRDLVTTPPSPGTWSQYPLPPPGPGHNTPSPPRDLVTTPPSPPPDYAQAGGTHPTGMHSCIASNLINLRENTLVSLMNKLSVDTQTSTGSL